ncbi:nitrilase-related carbon-nitrogen hydrolase [Janibacter sp. LM]|uniref:nitrilase-related carbon-nitrogen hydrolase n=1 Tax=Janibacter sp. LM TaxID=3144845 RepID=UPI0031F672A7
MSERTLRVGLTQWHATRDVAANVELALRAIRGCAAEEADLVVLPENGLMLGTNVEMREAAFSEGGDPHLERIAEAARENDVVVVVGGLKNRTDEGTFNSALVYDRSGAVVGRYDKIHLFDARIGGQSFEASSVEQAGAAPVIVDVDGVAVGITVCYDVRFPELYRTLALEGAEVILVPAAFTRVTGAAHWEVLLRSRAIESAAFVIASATVHGDGEVPDAFETWGHALAVGPWGEVLADLGEEPFATTVLDLDLGEVSAARDRLPVLRGVRPDAYRAETRRFTTTGVTT